MSKYAMIRIHKIIRKKPLSIASSIFLYTKFLKWYLFWFFSSQQAVIYLLLVFFIFFAFFTSFSIPFIFLHPCFFLITVANFFATQYTYEFWRKREININMETKYRMNYSTITFPSSSILLKPMLFMYRSFPLYTISINTFF